MLYLCRTSWKIEIHCVSWYFMYILTYRYYLGIQLLQRRCIYIYTYTVYIYTSIHSTLYLHWQFLICDCQVAFWSTRQFQWNSFSKWKCKFQSTVPAQVVTIFLAYFMVTCCINAQARQPFYRYNSLVRLLKCFLCLVLCPSGYHNELILTQFKFYPQSWVHLWS